MLYIKILGMLLVVAASYGIGKTIGVYQNRRVEDIYELLIFVRMANGHLAYSASEITEIIREGSDKAAQIIILFLMMFLFPMENTRFWIM